MPLSHEKGWRDAAFPKEYGQGTGAEGKKLENEL